MTAWGRYKRERAEFASTLAATGHVLGRFPHKSLYDAMLAGVHHAGSAFDPAWDAMSPMELGEALDDMRHGTTAEDWL